MEEEKMYKFINVESPGKDLEFNLECKDNYHFLDGNTYRMPKKVALHLNSLGYPIYEEALDPRTKQPYSKKTGFRNRFSVVEVGEVPKEPKAEIEDTKELDIIDKPIPKRGRPFKNPKPEPEPGPELVPMG